ncbi:amidase domain-containing protein [uncultured Clostridium sp.]|uniref:amidase domain-containing protein n=1 Tax=uncultured Clostridium sp. TaxID=59620 RepID=UPI0025CBABB2|nr:amidase domain-containing protein [uncultured Clostridium sp.]
MKNISKISRIVLIIITIMLLIQLGVGNLVSAQDGGENEEKKLPLPEKEEITKVVEKIFNDRNRAILEHDLSLVKDHYNTDSKYGMWAYEYEEKKANYLHNWEEKQGAIFVEIKPKVVIKSLKGTADKVRAYLICSTEYQYMYEDNMEVTNVFRIGTDHTLTLARDGDRWIIVKEWYKDPFGDSLELKNLKSDDVKSFIMSQETKDLEGINERRKGIIEYGKQFCGGATEEQYGFKYNKKYRNYNPEGGDCANFASQMLHEGGKFKKNSSWNCDGSGATGPWVNAGGFKNYMVNSGRASVIAYGNYEKVYKLAYKMLPGDFVAYEAKGDVNHISMVTGVDSKGYPLVTCHNTDRYMVPWDLGWSNPKIKFWLVRTHC